VVVTLIFILLALEVSNGGLESQDRKKSVEPS